MNKLYLMLLLITSCSVSMPGYSSPISTELTGPNLTLIGDYEGLYSVSNSVTGNFSDTWEFTLGDTLDLLAGGISNNTYPNKIDSFGFQLQRNNLNEWFNVGGFFDASASYSSLDIGNYRFLVSGDGNGVSGQGSYVFSVLVSSPVPLPQTWGMMMVGVVFLFGLRMHRDKDNQGSMIAI